ncbi:MAG: hypothetical protein P4L93_11150 [Coriobacteriia bacterium]|nr:hypothetical protein [Coriobacteriia bacterium]
MRFERKRLWLGIALTLVVVGALLIALPFIVMATSASASGAGRQPLAMDSAAKLSSPPQLETTTSMSASSSPASQLASTTVARPATVSVAATPAPAPVTTAAPSLDAYRGLGTWVDLYDSTWSNPGAAVADMAAHGVRTLYLETSNSRSNFALKDTAALTAFIQTAHSHHMKVVAWYLPDLTKPATDFYRVSQAINFTTPDGQRFDSFALDIESSAIKSESTRNRLMNALSQRIRGMVGASYPLGGIIPSPVGLAKKAGYWNDFPYSSVARTYDVLLPMGYYTYHGSTASAAYADAHNNVGIIRAQPGCASVPVHLIGGLSDNSSAAQVRSFVSAQRAAGCIGASLYSYPRTTAADWVELRAVAP